jgi:hypothetical protein
LVDETGTEVLSRPSEPFVDICGEEPVDKPRSNGSWWIYEACSNGKECVRGEGEIFSFGRSKGFSNCGVEIAVGGIVGLIGGTGSIWVGLYAYGKELVDEFVRET